MRKIFHSVVFWLVLGLVVLFGAGQLLGGDDDREELRYDEFVGRVQDGQVLEVEIKDQSSRILGELETDAGERIKFETTFVAESGERVTELLSRADVPTEVDAEESSFWLSLAVQLLPILLIVGVFLYFLNSMQGGGRLRPEVWEAYRQEHPTRLISRRGPGGEPGPLPSSLPGLCLWWGSSTGHGGCPSGWLGSGPTMAPSSPNNSDNGAKAEGGGTSGRVRRSTETSNFGVSRRESHDSSAFYARFDAPILSKDAEVRACSVPDQLFCGDSRDMAVVEDKSIALVATSPPYFSAKLYEEALGQGHVPGSYLEYLTMLEDVFAECRRVLEPGGRIAVNVANLGRRPYRSLSKDVWVVLERLGFLSQAEVVWIKGKGASGSAAFGSFCKASRPVLRDLTERVLIASKGRFERAIHWQQRQAQGLAWESTIAKEDFLAWTLDTWEIRPESATRVGHPAPFPVELPRRLIQLYTYRGDVVLDPFMGSGSTAVAATTTDRRFVGFDTDPAYCELAQRRVDEARASTISTT